MGLIVRVGSEVGVLWLLGRWDVRVSVSSAMVVDGSDHFSVALKIATFPSHS